MVGEKLRKMRQQMRLSQEALAERVGVSRQTVAKWEAGESVPDLDMAASLAEVFGIPIDLLADKPTAGSDNGKYLFGAVRMNDRGQISLPKRCRDVFGLEPGDFILVLGDAERGIALVKLSGDMFPMPGEEENTDE